MATTKNRLVYLKQKKWQDILVRLKCIKASERSSKILSLVLYRGYKVDDIPQDDFEDFSRVVSGVFQEFMDENLVSKKGKATFVKVRYCTSHLFDRSNERWSPVNRLAH